MIAGSGLHLLSVLYILVIFHILSFVFHILLDITYAYSLVRVMCRHAEVPTEDEGQ